MPRRPTTSADAVTWVGEACSAKGSASAATSVTKRSIDDALTVVDRGAAADGSDDLLQQPGGVDHGAGPYRRVSSRTRWAAAGGRS